VISFCFDGYIVLLSVGNERFDEKCSEESILFAYSSLSLVVLTPPITNIRNIQIDADETIFASFTEELIWFDYPSCI
jgi:hypothetical protein